MTAALAPGDLAFLSDPPDLGLTGRVVWVTGAGRGLSRSIACALAGAGAKVFLSGRSLGPLEEVETIASEGGRAETIVGSVTEPTEIEAAVARIGESAGRLDTLANNAGISPYFVRSERLEPAQMRDVLETNLVGAFACTRSAFPLLERGEAPSVVNVSSVRGSHSHARMLAYAVAKGGMEMMTRTLADEWADRGIRVNSLASYLTGATLMADGGWTAR